MGLFDVESGKNVKLKKAYTVEGGKYVKLPKAYVVEGGKYVKVWSGFEPFALAGVTFSSPTAFELYKSEGFDVFSKVLSKTSDYGNFAMMDYAEGKYFCVCNKYPNVNILVTEDGETYTVGTINTGYSINNGFLFNWIIFANDNYYFAFCNSATKKVTIYSSSDAMTWTKCSEVTISTTGTGCVPLIYGYGMADVTKKKFYLENMASDDCITWTSCSIPTLPTLGEDGYIYYLSGTSTNSTIWLYKGNRSNLYTLSGISSGRTFGSVVQSPFNDNELLATATYYGSTYLYKISKTDGVVTDLSFAIEERFNNNYRYRPAKKICSAVSVSSDSYARFRYLSSENAWTYASSITGLTLASSNKNTIVYD